MSLEDDFNTLYGTFLDHKGETPGLGAEIAELPFRQQFHGKKFMSDDNQFISVNIVKKKREERGWNRTPRRRHFGWNNHLPWHRLHAEKLHGSLYGVFSEDES